MPRSQLLNCSEEVMYQPFNGGQNASRSPRSPRSQTAFEFGRSGESGFQRPNYLTYNPIARNEHLVRARPEPLRTPYFPSRGVQSKKGIYGFNSAWRVQLGQRSSRRNVFPLNSSNLSPAANGSFLTSRSFMVLLTGIFCVLGGGWQLYTILDNYMRYEMTSEVYFTKESPVSPPGFSLCFPYVELLNWSALPPPLNRIDQSFWKYELNVRIREEIEDQIQKNLKVSDVFKLTPDIKWLIVSGYARNSQNFRVDYDYFSHAEVLKYVKDDLVCYKLNHELTVGDWKSKNKTFFHSHHIAFGQERGVHMAISLDKDSMDHLSHAVIYVHPHHQLPRGDRDFPLNYMASNVSCVFGNSSSYIGVTYSKVTIKLLKAPYSTSCYDYSTHKSNPFLHPEANITIESWYHCVHHCMWKKAAARFRETSLTSTYNHPVDLKIMSKYSLYNSSLKEQLMDEMLDACKKSCPGQSCDQVYYVPALVTTRESNHITFLLYDMIGLETISNFQPKMRVVELLVQVLSVSGVWLGLSCVDIILPLCKFTIQAAQNQFACLRAN